MSTHAPEAPKVFISYSRRDRRDRRGRDWLEDVRVHLKQVERQCGVEVWDDRRIEPGKLWEEEIVKALAGAKVAVVLLSANYLASDFIHQRELPLLLRAAEEGRTVILPVLLSAVDLAHAPEILRIQMVNDPASPLNGMGESMQDEMLAGVAKSVRVALGHHEPVVPDAEPPRETDGGAGATESEGKEPEEVTRRDEPSHRRSRTPYVVGVVIIAALVLILLVVALSKREGGATVENRGPSAFGGGGSDTPAGGAGGDLGGNAGEGQNLNQSPNANGGAPNQNLGGNGNQRQATPEQRRAKQPPTAAELASGYAADIVRDRARARGYVVEVKREFEPTTKEYRQAERLYNVAKAEYESWATAVKTAIELDTLGSQNMKEDIGRRSERASAAANEFITYVNNLPFDMPGKSPDSIFQTLASTAAGLADLLGRERVAMQDDPAKVAAWLEVRRKVAEDFAASTKWQEWGDIKESDER